MLRPYFLDHWPLLGRLCRAAYETVRDLMAEAAGEPALKPGLIAVVETFSDSPHLEPPRPRPGERGRLGP